MCRIKSKTQSKTQYTLNPAADNRDPYAIPSAPEDRAKGHTTFLRPKPEYTGSEVQGVALLHKQAYQPVRRDNSDDARHMTKMRRN